MLSRQKILLEKYSSPLVQIFGSVSPNMLTVIGSIPSILFFVCIIFHWYVVALIVFLGNTFDLVDGMVARKFGKVTAFGGLLDSTFDRFADFLIITAFAFGNLVQWEIVAPLFLFSFLTSYIRSRGELAAKNHVSFAIGIIERPERLVIVFLALLMYVLFPHLLVFHLNVITVFFILLTILACITVIQRLILAYQKL